MSARIDKKRFVQDNEPDMDVYPPPRTTPRRGPLFRSNMTGNEEPSPYEDAHRRTRAIAQIATHYEEKGGAQSEDPYADPGALANAGEDYDVLKKTEKGPRWKEHMKAGGSASANYGRRRP